MFLYSNNNQMLSVYGMSGPGIQRALLIPHIFLQFLSNADWPIVYEGSNTLGWARCRQTLSLRAE
jgi:hypothetical protein